MENYQEDINPYVEENFKLTFVETELYSKIKQDYRILKWDKYTNRQEFTPRQMLGDTIHYLRSYYYIEKLLETKPKTILDLGCGWNIFKKYIPNIYGVDKNTEYADEFINVNEPYFYKFVDSFDAAISINALHFVSLTQLEKVINDFVSVIKSNGRGYLAINLMRLIEKTPDEEKVIIFNTPNPSIIQYEFFIRKILKKIKVNYLIVDVDFKLVDEHLNGNISIVFDKIN